MRDWIPIMEADRMTRLKIVCSKLFLAFCLTVLCTSHLFAAQTFTDIGAGITKAESSSIVWGDYDNDGDLDLALAGFSRVAWANVSKI